MEMAYTAHLGPRLGNHALRFLLVLIDALI